MLDMIMADEDFMNFQVLSSSSWHVMYSSRLFSSLFICVSVCLLSCCCLVVLILITRPRKERGGGVSGLGFFLYRPFCTCVSILEGTCTPLLMSLSPQDDIMEDFETEMMNEIEAGGRLRSTSFLRTLEPASESEEEEEEGVCEAGSIDDRVQYLEEIGA